jgi:hypothetical protein
MLSLCLSLFLALFLGGVSGDSRMVLILSNLGFARSPLETTLNQLPLLILVVKFGKELLKYRLCFVL